MLETMSDVGVRRRSIDHCSNQEIPTVQKGKALRGYEPFQVDCTELYYENVDVRDVERMTEN